MRVCIASIYSHLIIVGTFFVMRPLGAQDNVTRYSLLNIPRVCDLSCLIGPLTSSSLDEGIRTQPCFLTITFSTVYLDSRMDNLKCNRLTCRKVVSEKAVVVRLLGVRCQLMAEAIYCRQHVRQLVVLFKSRLTIR